AAQQDRQHRWRAVVGRRVRIDCAGIAFRRRQCGDKLRSVDAFPRRRGLRREQHYARASGAGPARQDPSAQPDGLRLPHQPGRGYRAAVLPAAPRMRSANSVAAAAALALGCALSHMPARAQARDDAPESAARLLAAAKSWGYQLQSVDPDEIAAAPYDMIV